MKKAISLRLALVLCLSLCACGGSIDETKDETSVFIGKWDARTDRLVLIVNEDQTAWYTYESKTVAASWVYDENSAMLIVTPEDESFSVLSFTYNEEADTLDNPLYVCERIE